MVGGTIWKIVKDGEEVIVYAVDYNHKKERSVRFSLPRQRETNHGVVYIYRHLDGAMLESLSRPHLLITDAYNALSVQARRKERDQALLSKQNKKKMEGEGGW